MTKGLDLIWAMEYILREKRQAENRDRDEALAGIVSTHLSQYSFADSAHESTATAVQLISRLRTFSNQDIMYTIQVLSQLFPRLNDMSPYDAEKIIEAMVVEVKAVSSKTFGSRTRLSTLTTILRTAEPGFLETEAEHQISEADYSGLLARRLRVQDAVVENGDDFVLWQANVYDLFLQYRLALDRSRKSKEYFRNTDTNVRMYRRNWFEWTSQPGLLEELLPLVSSGAAGRFGERRIASEQNRQLRNSLRNPAPVEERQKFVMVGSTSRARSSASLEIVVSTTSFASLVSKKVWQELPSGSDVVRDWIQAVLTIWGSMAVAEGFSVTCIYKSTQGSSEISFNAMNAQEAATKVLQFVQVSAD